MSDQRHVRLKPVNLPRPVEVETGTDGQPQRIRWRGRWRTLEVTDCWRIDEEWWLEGHAIARTYAGLLLEGEVPLTVFRDDLTGAWFQQHYD